MANASNILAVLADPTRRTLVEQLRNGPMTVTQLSETTPVTRSAVSQHLQLLKAAALVVERREGTRHFYSLEPAAFGELRAYVDQLWSDALGNFSTPANQEDDDGDR
jgi:DNA-binding transcriptional ArsR family regulator